MARDVVFFGFYLTLTAGLAQAFFDGTEQIQDYRWRWWHSRPAHPRYSPTVTTLGLQRSEAKTQAKAAEAQAAHERRMRRIDRDNGRGARCDRTRHLASTEHRDGEERHG